MIEQPIELRQAIKLMPVYDQIILPVGRGMQSPLHQPHVAERDAKKLFQKLIVVSADERYLRLFAILSEQLLHKNVVLIRPVPLAPQLPAVNEISDDVQIVALRIP